MFVRDLRKILEDRKVNVAALARPLTGLWKAPEAAKEEKKERMIMWPPVILVVNTRLFQDGDKV